VWVPEFNSQVYLDTGFIMDLSKNMQTNWHTYKAQKQQGAVLVMALVLMAVLAIIGVTSMRGNIMDVKIHKAMKSRSNAFQCAEAALRAGETWLGALTIAPASDSVLMTTPSKNAYQFWSSQATALQNMETQTTTWWTANAWAYGTGMTNTSLQIGCTTPPLYLIEHLGYVDGGSNSIETGNKDLIDYFRITARSEGINTAAAVVLQTIYGKRLR